MLENFRLIREIDSLMRTIENHEVCIQKESRRIHKIIEQISNRCGQKKIDSDKLKSISLEITSMENDLNFNIGKKEKKESQKASVFTESQISALENELVNLKLTIEDLETRILEKMEIKENLILDIQDADEFEKGANLSLREIKKEVHSFTQIEKEKIQNFQKRITALKGELSLDFKNKLDNTLSKNLRTTSLAKIENKCCHYCKMQIDSIKINAVEDKHQFKTCSQCQRVLMPSSSFY